VAVLAGATAAAAKGANAMKYRRRPTIVEAEQWFPGKDVPGVQQENAGGLNPGLFYVDTVNGRTYPAAGDWVITECDGKRSLCKPDVFDATYIPVQEEAIP
jgi:hypothetical protein